ncbi:hypothetical protein [Bacillus sp. V5-8f]|uniref:hypothetical protein n=1 Tax=Bacillus sp. V5-8f TaxID=2053044 RepID=UPI0015E09A7C|nr:hypothetical protein [Bacillus sp. V5-8f]
MRNHPYSNRSEMGKASTKARNSSFKPEHYQKLEKDGQTVIKTDQELHEMYLSGAKDNY